MDPTVLAYVAGLIDGEGSIMLLKEKANREFRRIVISMSNTEYSLLKFLQGLFGGSIRTQKKYRSNHKQAYLWSVQYNKAMTMIKLVRPYLQHPEKIRRADLLLDVYPRLISRNGKYSKEQTVARHKFEEKFLHPSVP